jgi:hypothetical protein
MISQSGPTIWTIPPAGADRRRRFGQRWIARMGSRLPSGVTAGARSR